MPTTGSRAVGSPWKRAAATAIARADVLDLHLGHAEPERPRDHERRRAALDRVGGEVVAVAGEAGHAEEQVAGLHRAVVVGQARDLHVGRALAEQVAQGHSPGVYELEAVDIADAEARG